MKIWKIRNRSKQLEPTSENPEKKELRTRRHLIESRLDALMLNNAVGGEYYDKRYNYEAVRKRQQDLPLTRWSKEETWQWKRRRRETSDINHTFRRIPIEQDGTQAILIVKVYPAELEDKNRAREWSTGNIQLVLGGESEEGRGLT